MPSISSTAKVIMKFSKNKLKKLIHTLHRDIGFLVVGLCLVYAISGILMNHLKGSDPAYKVIEDVVMLDKGMTKEAVEEYFGSQSELPALRRVLDGEAGYRLMLEGGQGTYNAESGELAYKYSKKKTFIYWINRLHYNKAGVTWTVVADVFAGILIFLAITGLFMGSSKKNIAGRGKWFVLAGLLIPILYILLFT